MTVYPTYGRRSHFSLLRELILGRDVMKFNVRAILRFRMTESTNTFKFARLIFTEHLMMLTSSWNCWGMRGTEISLSIVIVEAAYLWAGVQKKSTCKVISVEVSLRYYTKFMVTFPYGYRQIKEIGNGPRPHFNTVNFILGSTTRKRNIHRVYEGCDIKIRQSVKVGALKQTSTALLISVSWSFWKKKQVLVWAKKYEYLEWSKMQLNFCTPRWMFGLVDRLVRRGSLVQTLLKGADISVLI